MGLTAKQAAFVEAYAGNGTDAARKAGYTGSDAVLGKTAYDLLRNPKVAQLIADRSKRASFGRIASREERQAFWTKVMLDADGSMFDRLKASELLGKSDGDFVTRVAGADGGPLQVSFSIDLGGDE